MANPADHWTGYEMSISDQFPLNYACAEDDDKFIRAPNRYKRRIEWVYWAVGYVDPTLLEILEGNAEDVWLWVDGDEVILPTVPDPWREPPYALAAKALQRRQQTTMATRFESRPMAERRQRVQSEAPAVRLAAIVWLVYTSGAVKERQSEWMDREKWGLADLICTWWDTLSPVHDALPLAASISEFERMMDEHGHSCHREYYWYATDPGDASLAAWLHVQLALFPECAAAPVNLMHRSYGEQTSRCEVCHNYERAWMQDWILELETSGISEGVLTNLGCSFLRTGNVRRLVTACAFFLNYKTHFLSTLNTIIAKRYPETKLILVPANPLRLERPEGNPQKALLAVIIRAGGIEILHFTSRFGYAADHITDINSLRNILESANCNLTMKQLSMPLVMGVMELLLFEIKLRAPNHKLCNYWLRRLSKKHGVLPPSFLIYNAQQDGNFPVKSGGSADVYKGRLNQEVVCLKVLRYFSSFTPADRQKLIQSFCHEALVWKQLDHPNILPFLGVSADLFHPSVCLISPWMHNGNINDFLQENPGHDRHKAITEIADAINYLHSYDPPVVHADIRGGNVLVTPDLRCCLADFGLAAVVESEPFTASTASRSLGTVRWMAPEYFQEDGLQTLKPTRDIYAFGCTILEIFTGRPPFYHLRQEIAVLSQVVGGKRPQRDNLPFDRSMYYDKLWSLLESCWHQDPAGRPTAATILNYLNVLEQPYSRRFGR